MTDTKCLLYVVEQRLIDCLNSWVMAKECYFKPEEFRLAINNCIQSLRNVTWILQSNQKHIKEFRVWYGAWQDKMKSDPVLRWLVDSRNTIVKQGDLVTLSKMRVEIVDSWLKNPVFEMEFPVLSETESAIGYIINDKPEWIKDRMGLLRIERLWVDSSMPDCEILEALTHVFSVLSSLINDAHKHLVDNHNNECPFGDSSSAFQKTNIPCMMAQEWDRSIWVDWHTGGGFSYVESYIEEDKSLQDMAKKRYSIENNQFPKGSESFYEKAKVLFDLAKIMIQKDGSHVPIAFIGYPKDHEELRVLISRDRQQKHIMIRRLATDMKKTGAISIILINEIWLGGSSDSLLTKHELQSSNRKEGIQLIAANSEGELYSFCSIFERRQNEVKILNEEVIVDCEHINFIKPITEIWEKKGN